MIDGEFSLRVPCGRGLVNWLEDELDELGFTERLPARTWVDLHGTLPEAASIVIWSRLATTVLVEIGRFPCTGPRELYEGVSCIPWEQWLDPDGYVSVHGHVKHPMIRNSMYANQLVKDALCDRMVDRMGRRPDSGPDRSGVVVDLYWAGDEARVYLDAAGRKLTDRGYRRDGAYAPLRESLAAAMVRASGLQAGEPVVAPMCGSGTLGIEAALASSGRPPGLLRPGHAMEQWLGFDHEAWKRMRAAARKQGGQTTAPIILSDTDAYALESARANAQTAGVLERIDLRLEEFDATPLCKDAVIFVNPPWGLRMGEEEALVPLYRALGDWMKQGATGGRGYVLTGSPRLAKEVGLRPSRRMPFVVGDIECRLLEFPLH